MQLGDRVRLEEAFGGQPAGSVGVVVGFFRNGDRPDAIVSFEDGESVVVPVRTLAATEERD
jgi:hypothetical protein